MKNYLAYIDESGDPVFAEGASKTFFIGAVIIDKEKYPEISDLFDKLKRTFRINELKSKQIRSFDRRFDICQFLCRAGFQIASIHVKKKLLYGEWFERKQTFYKYIQRLLNHEIYRVFGSVNVSIDKYGSPEYQASMQRYLENKLQAELFTPEILIGPSSQVDFIQLSDFIVGTIRKALEGDFDDNDKLLQLFRPMWPIRLQLPDQGSHVKPVPAGTGIAELQACMDEAWLYLERNKRKLNDPKLRTLEYLYYVAIDGKNDWVYTQEILAWLRGLGLELSEEQFRNEVTASLRDEGLIIVGSRKGIKIPWTAEDFREYVVFSVNLALPVLRRLKKAMTFVSTNTSFTDVKSLVSDEVRNILNQVDA